MKTKDRGKLTRALLASLALAVLVVVGVVYAATVVVDSFDDDDASQNISANDSNTPVRNSADGGSGTDILGQYRDIEVVSDSCTDPNDLELKIDVGVSPGTNYLDFSEDTNCGGTARITWDGDNTADGGRSYSLGGEDLADSSSNEGFLLQITTCDHDTTLEMRGYENSSDYSTLSLDIDGSQDLERLDIFFPFSEFTDTGNGADWSSLEALEFEIDGTVAQELQIVIDNLESSDIDGVREYGDLPDGTGGTPDYSDGDNELAAYHSNPQGLTLGYNLDHEGSENASSDTQGDDNSDYDDEDGLTSISYQEIPPSSGTYYYIVNVVFNGCDEGCWLNGWVDLNSDGDFGDTSEHFINDVNRSSSGTYQGYISAPSSSGYYYTRLRICDADGECDSPSENATNGEVEDYRLYMDPTAVELSAFTVTWQDDAVEVAWETAMEIDTAGFNLWRSTTENGDYVQVNDALIPTQFPGGTWGGSYAFTDEDVTPGTTYFYKLEELEMGGVHNWYGPTVTQQETGGGTGPGPNALTLSTFTAKNALPAWDLLILGAGIVAVGITRRRRRS